MSDPPVAVRRKARAQDGHEAARAVARAAPNGQTLLLASRLPDRATFDALQPVAVVATIPYVFVVLAGGATFDLRSFCESAGSRTDRMLIATLGARTAGYMALDRMRRRAVAIQPVVYNGGHAALQAAVAEHAAAAFVPLPSVMPYLAGGRVRVLAVAEGRRHPGIPRVPTTAEMGDPDLLAVGWFGIFAPAAMPRDNLHRLESLLSGSASAPETRETFLGLGVTLEHRDANQFGRLLASEVLPM